MHIIATTIKTLQEEQSHNTLQTTRNKARYNPDKYLDNKESNKSETGMRTWINKQKSHNTVVQSHIGNISVM